MKEREALQKEQQALFEERRQLLATMQDNKTPAPEDPENLLSRYLCTVGTITLTIAAVLFLKKRYQI